MKHIVLLAGAAALGFSAPAMAKPGGGPGGPHGMGMGGPHGNPHSMGIGFAGQPSGRVGFGAGGCPPGLAKKAVPCVPPGQVNRQFSVGERLPSNLGLLSFGALPRTVRSRFGSRLNRHSRFISTDEALVSVNPRTHRVERVIRMR